MRRSAMVDVTFSLSPLLYARIHLAHILPAEDEPGERQLLPVPGRLWPSAVSLACGGGSGGRCGWKLRSREAGSALAHAGMGDGHAERGGFPHESNLGRGQAVGLVCEVAEGALQVQGSGGEGAGGLESAGAFLAQGVEAGD